MTNIDWRLDRRLARLAERERHVELLLIDIFDTLLFRRCQSPHDVYTHVGRKAVELRLIRRGLTPWEFSVLRRRAEAAAQRLHFRKDEHEDCSIEEIYSSLPQSIGNSEQLASLEHTIDSDLVYVNPVIADLIDDFHARGIPVCLVSNTYYSRNQLEGILHSAGCEVSKLTAIFSSSQEGVRKNKGGLFRRVIERMAPTNTDNVWHIGDNRDADYEGALDAGLQAIYYGSDDEVDRVLQWENVRYGTVLGEIESLRRLVAHLHDDNESTAFICGAMVLGPVLSAFADWVAETCRQENIRCLWGLMREGGLLASLVQHAADSRGVELQAKPFYVSRQVAFYARAEQVDDEIVERASERPGQTLGDFLGIFGIDANDEPWSRWKNDALLDAREAIIDGERLWDLLNYQLVHGELHEAASAYVSEQRRLLQEYIAQNRSGHEKIATVDLGWSGSIQRNINTIIEGDSHDRQAVHMLVVGDSDTVEILDEDGDMRGFLGSVGEGPTAEMVRGMMRSALVLEHLLSGTEGSTIGYRRSDEGVVPIMGKKVLGPDDDVRISCEKGIRLFQRFWLQTKASDGVSTNDSIIQACKMLHRLIDLPTPREADVVGRLQAELNHGTDTALPLCPEEGRRLIETLGPEAFFEIHQRELGYERIPWPQGCLTQSTPEFLILRYASMAGTDSYLISMMHYCRRMQAEGIDSVVAYGAGDVGKAFVIAAHMIGLRVTAVVDRNTRLHGGQINEVSIIALDDALAKGETVFAVTSYAFARHIEAFIEERAGAADVTVTIFSPSMH